MKNKVLLKLLKKSKRQARTEFLKMSNQNWVNLAITILRNSLKITITNHNKEKSEKSLTKMSRQIWTLEPGLIFLTIIPKISDQQGFADYSGIWTGAHRISTYILDYNGISKEFFWHLHILISILFSTEVKITEGQIGKLNKPWSTVNYLHN